MRSECGCLANTLTADTHFAHPTSNADFSMKRCFCLLPDQIDVRRNDEVVFRQSFNGVRGELHFHFPP